MIQPILWSFSFLTSSKNLVLLISATYAHGHTLKLVIANIYNSSIFLSLCILLSNHYYLWFTPSNTPTSTILRPLLGTSNSLILPSFHCLSPPWFPLSFLISLKYIIIHYNDLLHKPSILLPPLSSLYSYHLAKEQFSLNTIIWILCTNTNVTLHGGT